MRNFICGVLLVAACLAGGCSGSKQVNGKITQGGQPMTLSDKGMFILSFNPENATAPTYNATTKPDGTFTIVGPENKGIPPGKYKVNLQAMDPYSPSGGTDKLGGKYVPGKSTLVVEIGKGDLVIDVPK